MSESTDRVILAKLLLKPIQTVYYFSKVYGGTVNYSQIQCLFVPKITIPLANYIALTSCGGLKAMLKSKQLRHIFQSSKQLLTLVANNGNEISSPTLYPKLISYVNEQERKGKPEFWKDIKRKVSVLYERETNKGNIIPEDALSMNKNTKSVISMPRKHEGNIKHTSVQKKEVEKDIEHFTSLLLLPVEAFLWHLKESKDGIKRRDLKKILDKQKTCPIKLEERDFLILSQLGGIDRIATSDHLNPLILFDTNSGTIKLKQPLGKNTPRILRKCLHESIMERRASLKPDAWRSICNNLKKTTVKDSSFPILCGQIEVAKLNIPDTVATNPSSILELDSTSSLFDNSGLLPLCSLANQSNSYFRQSTSVLLTDLLLEPLRALFVYFSFLTSSMSTGEIERFFKIILESHFLRKSTGTALHLVGGIAGISSSTSLRHLFDNVENDGLKVGHPLKAVFRENLHSELFKSVEEIVSKIPTGNLSGIKKRLFTDLMDELAFTKLDILRDHIRNSDAKWKSVYMLLPIFMTLSQEFAKNPCLSTENMKSIFFKEVSEDSSKFSTAVLQLVERMGGIANFLSSHEFIPIYKAHEAQSEEINKSKERLLITVFASVCQFLNNTLLQKPGLIGDFGNIPNKYFKNEKSVRHEKLDPHSVSEAHAAKKAYTVNNTKKLAVSKVEQDKIPDKTKEMSLKLSNLLSAENKERQILIEPSKQAMHFPVQFEETKVYSVHHLNLLILRKSVKGIGSPKEIISFLNNYFLVKMEKSFVNQYLENLEKLHLITDIYPRKLTPIGEEFLSHPNEWDPSKMSENKYVAISHELQKKREKDIYDAYLEKEIGKKRRKLVSEFLKSIQHLLSSKLAIPVQVHTLGSFKTGLMTKHSDVDLVVTSKKPLMKNFNSILKLLYKRYKEIIPIRHAKAPVIKFSTPEGLRCDLTFDSMLAVQNSCLIKAYLGIDERVKVFVSTIKSWASLRMIDKSQFSFPSSYTWCIMALFYLQQLSPPLLPNLQAKNSENSHKSFDSNGEPVNCWFEAKTEVYKEKAKLNKSSVNDLLLGFFYYYSSSKSGSFNWNQDAIDISYDRPIAKRLVKNASHAPMMVMDPFLKNKNLTSVLNPASRDLVQYEMERAYRILNDYNATINSLMNPSVR
ncbi:poly(A/U) polymerase Cid16 [Schizosaccharomyces osmophilus]|uniref:polynucleotide adenylyltransferase n=1 Tax=Schizosaccharomyces osmophilus TaxID=2545709 RepID=A0AAE9WBJ9_9SCHI|nr:poly(A/U) polymerase Cid16 [Schizosaccharomyces osmophilus]WBW73185.1 poly(A/U) polymerase Cid16 [Schizosaccharomyces osmophilus]